MNVKEHETNGRCHNSVFVRDRQGRLCQFELNEIAISANGDGALAQLVAIILM